MQATRPHVIRVLRASSLALVAVAVGVGVAGAEEEAGADRLTIAGVVRDAQGVPIPSVRITREGAPRVLQSPPPWLTNVHGKFLVDDSPAGPVTLIATIGSTRKRVETRGGASDVVIVLEPGPQLLLRIADYVPTKQTRTARLLWVLPGVGIDVRYAPIRDDGWTRFVALPPEGEFELWAEAENDVRHVCARGLKAGDTEQRVERHEVKDIAGKVRVSQALLAFWTKEGARPSQVLRVDVFAYPPQSLVPRVADTRLQEDGSFRVRGLPPGTYTVIAGTHAGRIVDVGKQVEAGTMDVVLDLE